VASAGNDCRVMLWDISSGKLIFNDFGVHKGAVNCLKFNPYEITMASAGSDKLCRYWDLENSCGLEIGTTSTESTTIE
jgi:WD40 repeat protein